jgi:hypothetical protein
MEMATTAYKEVLKEISKEVKCVAYPPLYSPRAPERERERERKEAHRMSRTLRRIPGFRPGAKVSDKMMVSQFGKKQVRGDCPRSQFSPLVKLQPGLRHKGTDVLEAITL